jgi:hypothetical protein
MLLRIKGERSILNTIKGGEADWIGHNWRENWIPKHIFECGKKEE